MNDIVFRKDFNGAGATVEIAPQETAKRYRVGAHHLARSVASSESLPGSLECLAVANPKMDFEEWRQHQWAGAIQCFVSSLDRDYVDHEENYPEVHEKVLLEYAKESEMPVSGVPVGDPIKLDVPAPTSLSVVEALLRRRTTLVPSRRSLTLDELAAILYRAMARIRAFRTPAIESRPELAMTNFAPALDVYVLVFDVEGLGAGVYAYDIRNHTLTQKQGELDRKECRRVIVGQPATETAAVTLLYVLDVERHQWRYRHPRALRGMWIDTAKAVNELLWELSSRSIIPHITPALSDTRVLELLDLPTDMTVHAAYAVSFSGE
ncbi:hypothetical protein H8R18_07590 [Nanchangia anserum]|uniref:Nitroreductase domain-containing protein n=1 Tax=Nanchangia anserum TaxID=2692125 RepID=A0A8I0GBT1_9ACTO|nr:hypothetical protein [Nanchangia anserum]MBD3689386.1 hypothetical protein [Nanchangia anserum]QOX81593.1 hypothetical protein H8R18_07590 [Nanchangia anserum]